MQAFAQSNTDQLDYELAEAHEELEQLQLIHMAKKIAIESKIVTLTTKKIALKHASMPSLEEERILPDLY